MKFEKYKKQYPEVCAGCNSIAVAYQQKSSPAAIDEICGIFYGLKKTKADLNTKPCPCMDCLVKTKCRSGCKPFNDKWELLEDLVKDDN